MTNRTPGLVDPDDVRPIGFVLLLVSCAPLIALVALIISGLVAFIRNVLS